VPPAGERRFERLRQRARPFRGDQHVGGAKQRRVRGEMDQQCPAFAVFFALLSTNSINFTKIVNAEDAKLSAEGREGEFLCGLCENLCALCV